MAQIKCKKCGVLIPDTIRFCPRCGARQSNSVPPSLSSRQTQQAGIGMAPPPAPVRSGNLLWLWIVLAVIALGGIGGGIWYYNTKYLPEKRDREALRTYPMVNVQIRSSKEVNGVPNNKLIVGPGAELITYELDDEWAKVKYVSSTGDVTEGYVRSPYLLSKKDFTILNSILADDDVRADIESSKVRRALLGYFLSHGYFGKLSSSTQQELGLSANSDNQWQVIYHHGKERPNEALFTRLTNPDSKYQDMAVLIENLTNGNRRILYFRFDNDETPHLVFDGNAPGYGNIEDIELDYDEFRVNYTDGYAIYPVSF